MNWYCTYCENRMPEHQAVDFAQDTQGRQYCSEECYWACAWCNGELTEDILRETVDGRFCSVSCADLAGEVRLEGEA